MRLSDIIGMLKEYFMLAMVAVILFTVITIILYRVVRKRNPTKKPINLKKWILLLLLIGYLVMVIGVTVLNRGTSVYGAFNFALFSSYKEAWMYFDRRHFLFLTLNILMFVPLGILLPLIHKRWQNIYWLLITALGFTLCIESFQALTGYGIFELDDLLNNTIGAFIGYGFVICFIQLKNSRWKRAGLALTPLLMMVLLFTGMYIVYQLQEFGNLSLQPIQKQNLKKTEIMIAIDTMEQAANASVYKAPSINRKEADQQAMDLFSIVTTEEIDLEIIPYEDEIVYWQRGEDTYNLWLTLADGSYQFTEFNDDQIPLMDAAEKDLRRKLGKRGLSIPEEAEFTEIDRGTYAWKMKQIKADDKMMDGELIVSHYAEHSIKEIRNNLITYENIASKQLKSTADAATEIRQGKFQYFGQEKIKQIIIKAVEIAYQLDSKGYYQPVYVFSGEINGEAAEIKIAALAK